MVTHLHPMKVQSKYIEGQGTERACLCAQEIFKLCSHEHGCRVIQRLVSQCEEAQCREVIMDSLQHHILQLSKGMFGNFVVEALIDPCNQCNEYNGHLVLPMRSKIARNPEAHRLAWTLMPHLVVS